MGDTGNQMSEASSAGKKRAPPPPATSTSTPAETIMTLQTGAVKHLTFFISYFDLKIIVIIKIFQTSCLVFEKKTNQKLFDLGKLNKLSWAEVKIELADPHLQIAELSWAVAQLAQIAQLS